MIPKIIHYCWFGNGKKTRESERYIKTWKKYMPDYKIIEWNESNFNIEEANDYVREAYKAKKYAFVSDYVRLYALYNYGGIYFDTDIEVIKKFDELIDDKRDIYGFESKNQVMTGVIISQKESKVIQKFLEYYNDKIFKHDDGSLNLIPNTKVFTKILKENYNLNINGEFQENIFFKVYPVDYFCSFDLKNSCVCKSKNCRTIHHYNYSWSSNRKKINIKIKKILAKMLGRNFYDKIRKMKKKLKGDTNEN